MREAPRDPAETFAAELPPGRETALADAGSRALRAVVLLAITDQVVPGQVIDRPTLAAGTAAFTAYVRRRLEGRSG